MAHSNARLEELSELLNKDVELVDAPQKESQRMAASQVPSGTDLVNNSGVLPRGDRARGGLKQKAPRRRNKRKAQDVQPDVKSNNTNMPDEARFVVGEVPDDDFAFCPMKTMSSYLDRFVGKSNRPRAKPYFDTILEDRVWDIFYLHDPGEPYRDPHLLVPSAQFKAFLEEINRDLGTALKIPGGVNAQRFNMQFDEDVSRPRFLRQSRDMTSLDVRPWPKIHPKDVRDFAAASGADKAKWRAKIKAVKTGFLPKNDNSEKPSMKKMHRVQMLKNTQIYLDLKEDPSGYDVVFVCVDVEAIESAPNPISEVGFAILDMKDVQTIPPGADGSAWWSSIKCYHLRIREYASLRNYQYVTGCPDAFEFGKSTFPQKSETAKAIMDILDPFIQTSRNLVIVGHDVNQDIKHVQTLGVNLISFARHLGPIDTQDLHRAWRDSSQGRGLGNVLAELGIRNKNLHNAGNDAYYTLCAMVSIAVRSIREQQHA